MGGRHGKGGVATWATMMNHLREKLGCSRANLRIGLAILR